MDLTLNQPIAVLAPDGTILGVYWIRIYRTSSRAVVIITDVPANPGRSPTNAASHIARHLTETYPSELAARSVRWFECYPGGRFSSTTQYKEVRFEGPAMEPNWPSGASGTRRRTIEKLIGQPLQLLPRHEEVLERVLSAGGSLQEGDRSPRYHIVPSAELPPPHNPGQCAHRDRFRAYMQTQPTNQRTGHGERVAREQFYAQLTPADYQACRYHDADWRAVAAESVRIVRELGEDPDLTQLKHAVKSSRLPDRERGWLYSLFFGEPIMWSADGYIGGQHRSCALRASGAPLVVRTVDGPAGPPSTWTITDDA